MRLACDLQPYCFAILLLDLVECGLRLDFELWFERACISLSLRQAHHASVRQTTKKYGGKNVVVKRWLLCRERMHEEVLPSLKLSVFDARFFA